MAQKDARLDEIQIVGLDELNAEEFVTFSLTFSFYSREHARDMIERSTHNGISNTQLVYYRSELIGYRMCLAPGKWTPDVLSAICPLTQEKYLHPWNTYAYTYTAFMKEEFRSAGIYRRLWEIGVEVARKQGANGIIGHSWLRKSDKKKNIRVFEGLGLTMVKEHEGMWVDWFECPDCGVGKSCTCTSAEFMYEFDSHKKSNL